MKRTADLKVPEMWAGVPTVVKSEKAGVSAMSFLHQVKGGMGWGTQTHSPAPSFSLC